MMTQRLYFDDAYRTDFEATVVNRTEIDGKPGVVLDRTCFYPTGGGQGCDQGFLNDVPVVHVLEYHGEILHVLSNEIRTEKVRGKIGWKRRFDFMQQHSGQHVLSQSLLKVLGAKTVSAHLGEVASTIEIAREALNDDEVNAVEELANKIVFEDRAIKTYFVSANEIKRIPLRKMPPQKDRFRIVEIDSFDQCACGGTHCRRTGEIGLIKVGRRERIRKSVRLQFLCGVRALVDYRWKSKVVEDLAERYSTKGAGILPVVMKQAEENKELRRNLRNLSESVMKTEAQELISKAMGHENIKIVQAIFDHRPFEELKTLARLVVGAEPAVALFGNIGEKGQLVFACSRRLPYKMNELVSKACLRLDGGGGGSENLAFGGGPRVENVEAAIKIVSDRIRKV
jgi:alanyl-tRNA synthetase